MDHSLGHSKSTVLWTNQILSGAGLGCLVVEAEAQAIREMPQRHVGNVDERTPEGVGAEQLTPRDRAYPGWRARRWLAGGEMAEAETSTEFLQFLLLKGHGGALVTKPAYS